jgi:hypothetical protein
MATEFVKNLRVLVDSIRQIPGEMGMHERVVTRVTRLYSGGTIGRGSYTETSVILRNGNQNVHCELASQDDTQQIFGVGCEWHDGDYLVGPITPGTYSISGFDVAAGVAARIYYTIGGPGIGTETGTFVAVNRNFSKSFRWMLLLRRTEFGT